MADGQGSFVCGGRKIVCVDLVWKGWQDRSGKRSARPSSERLSNTVGRMANVPVVVAESELGVPIPVVLFMHQGYLIALPTHTLRALALKRPEAG